MTEAKARPIITAFTTMSASMNMLHGDRSRGSLWACTMAGGEDVATGVAAGVPGAVTSLAARASAASQCQPMRAEQARWRRRLPAVRRVLSPVSRDGRRAVCRLRWRRGRGGGRSGVEGAAAGVLGGVGLAASLVGGRRGRRRRLRAFLRVGGGKAGERCKREPGRLV